MLKAAGNREKTEIFNIPMDALMPIIKESLDAGQSVRFMPRGTSMLPMIRQGIDSVVIGPVQGKLEKYDIPLYQRENGQYVLHRIVEVQETTYTCMGDNQFVRERGVKHEQVIAVVTGFYRGKREYSVSAPGYKVYCRVWDYSRGLRHFWKRGMGWLRRHLK